MIRVLQAESKIDLQAYVTPAKAQGNSAHRQGPKSGQKKRNKAFAMSLVLYGTMDTFEDVGDFFSQCSEYLQAPLHCDRNVPYRNPQSLSGREENPPMTFELQLELSSSDIETLTQKVDPSSVLETALLCPESDPPAAVRTPLYR